MVVVDVEVPSCELYVLSEEEAVMPPELAVRLSNRTGDAPAFFSATTSSAVK